MKKNPLPHRLGQFSKCRLQADERSREALRLALEDHTVGEIATILGMSKSGAWDALRRGKNFIDSEAKEQLKTASLLAMEKRMKECMRLVDSADTVKDKLMAMELYRKFLNDLRTLCGLNEPNKTDITSGGEPILTISKEDLDKV